VRWDKSWRPAEKDGRRPRKVGLPRKREKAPEACCLAEKARSHSKYRWEYSPGFCFSVARRTEEFRVEKEGRLSRVQTEPAFDSNREGSGISEAAASMRVHGCDASSKSRDRSGNKDRGR
jgi:hypothetical protein